MVEHAIVLVYSGLIDVQTRLCEARIRGQASVFLLAASRLHELGPVECLAGAVRLVEWIHAGLVLHSCRRDRQIVGRTLRVHNIRSVIESHSRVA